MLQRLKNDMISEMKSKNKNKVKLNLLRVLIGDITTEMKNLKEGEVYTNVNIIKAIKKMSKDATIMGDNDEVKILSVYLPSNMNNTQLEALIIDIIKTNNFNGMKDMGKVMSKLKQNHDGTYDGSIASKIVRENL